MPRGKEPTERDGVPWGGGCPHQGCVLRAKHAGECKLGDVAEEDYEVEYIANEEKQGRKIMLLVKWRGWPESDNTWEPRSSLVGSCDMALRVWATLQERLADFDVPHAERNRMRKKIEAEHAQVDKEAARAAKEAEMEQQRLEKEAARAVSARRAEAVKEEVRREREAAEEAKRVAKDKVKEAERVAKEKAKEADRRAKEKEHAKAMTKEAKAKAKEAAKEAGPMPCPECGKLVQPNGLLRHLHTCKVLAESPPCLWTAHGAALPTGYVRATAAVVMRSDGGKRPSNDDVALSPAAKKARQSTSQMSVECP